MTYTWPLKLFCPPSETPDHEMKGSFLFQTQRLVQGLKERIDPMRISPGTFTGASGDVMFSSF